MSLVQSLNMLLLRPHKFSNLSAWRKVIHIPFFPTTSSEKQVYPDLIANQVIVQLNNLLMPLLQLIYPLCRFRTSLPSYSNVVWIAQLAQLPIPCPLLIYKDMNCK
jgi:hypothetical protein